MTHEDITTGKTSEGSQYETRIEKYIAVRRQHRTWVNQWRPGRRDITIKSGSNLTRVESLKINHPRIMMVVNLVP